MKPTSVPETRMKKLILGISVAGIALMALLGFLTLPVNYQMYAILYANQELKNYLHIAVAVLIAIGLALSLYVFIREHNDNGRNQ